MILINAICVILICSIYLYDHIIFKYKYIFISTILYESLLYIVYNV